MGRKTVHNILTSAEQIQKINPENERLMNDFLSYLSSTGRSKGTITGYKSDLYIFFVWCLKNAGNKHFVDITKKEIIAFQNWLITTNLNSPARIRRLKSALSSLSNYIETILDDEYPDYRSIVRKIEDPVGLPVRDKTVLTDEQCDKLLQELVAQGSYEKACCVALAVFSGRRKSELLRFKTDYFRDENIIFGSLYKTPEKIITKGRGGGEPLYCFILSKPFKPYFDLWMAERARLGIKSIWLFPDPNDMSKQRSPSTLNSWARTFSNILGIDFYFHACRHRFTTDLSRQGIPDSVIKKIVGWKSAEMVGVYKDIDDDEEIGKYFAGGKIVEIKPTSLSNL